MILQSLPSEINPTTAGTRQLQDIWLPSAPDVGVRIRTLVYDKSQLPRDAWLTGELPAALGDECRDCAIFLGRQIHGTAIGNADHDEPIHCGNRHEFPQCDGLLTRRRGVVLAVRTADCVPIVVTDATRPWIGTVHAGWRGTLAGILEQLLVCARRDGSRPQDLHLWIGPHIRACHFEISPLLSRQFKEAFPERPIMRGERHLSLLEVNIAQAARVGIPEANILSSPLCTFENHNGLPSYRRDGECLGEIVTTAVILSRP